MVIIYTLDGCTFCSQLKEGLDKEKIKYKEKDIDVPKYEYEFDKLSNLTKSEGVPVMVIGKQIFAPEVSFKTIGEAVSLAKKFTQP